MEDPLSPLNTSMQYPDHRLIEKERFLKLPANGGNTDPQHCCTNNNDNTVACCCVRVLQWSANGAVTLNNMQQGLQTDVKWNTQQCCVRLHGA